MLTAMTRPGNSREMMELVKDRTFTVSKENSEMRLCLGKARDLRKEEVKNPCGFSAVFGERPAQVGGWCWGLEADRRRWTMVNFEDEVQFKWGRVVTPRILKAKKVKETLNLRGTRRVKGRTRRVGAGSGSIRK